MQIAEILKGVPLFATLDESELARVAELAQIKGYLSGLPLFAAGDASDSFYIIARGRVEIRIPAQGAAEARKVSLGPGKFFGEMGVLSGTPRTADAVVEEDAVLVKISQGAFDRLMAIDGEISEKVMVAYMVRQAEFEERKGRTRGPSGPPRTFLFYSTGGGAGASFLACNVALKLRDLTRKKVLLLDLDVEDPVQHLYAGAQADCGLAGLLARPSYTPADLQEAALELHFGLDLLGGPAAPAPEHATPEKLTAVLQAAAKAYDFVIVDTASERSARNDALFRAADALHMVLTPDIVSVSRTVSRVRGLAGEGLEKKIRLVMNKFDPEEGFRPSTIEEKFGRPVLGRVEFEHALALGAVNEGLPLVKRNPRCTATVDLTRFARQIVSLQPGLTPEERPFSIWNLFG